MTRLVWASLAAALLGLAGCGGGDDDRTVRTAAVPDAATVKLTLAQAAGQRLVFPYAGSRPPRALERRIRRGEAAGVILFARNIRGSAALRRTIDRLQRLPRPKGLDAPLLVMVDQEGGRVRRLPGSPVHGAGATPSRAAARANGRAAARTLRAAHVNVDLAPVVDVARPGSAIDREGRTYGRDAAAVAARAGAFADGLRAGGVAPVLKHFPGMGAATVNTDDAPARITRPLAELRRVDLEPYREILGSPSRGIRAPAVMVATAVYPSLDPRPAAFSSRWVGGQLRGRLGFTGVVMTDDLQTPAVTRFGTPAQLAYFAARAGVDMPLFAKTYTAGARAAAGLQDAVRAGALSRRELEAGARRVLAWRATLPR